MRAEKAEGSPTPCYCYVVQCSDGSFYTGWTTNPAERVKTHNGGRGARYTRARRPVQLVFLEPQADRPSAMRRERAIKSMRRSQKLRLIAQMPATGISRGATSSDKRGRGRRSYGGG